MTTALACWGAPVFPGNEGCQNRVAVAYQAVVLLRPLVARKHAAEDQPRGGLAQLPSAGRVLPEHVK